MIYILGDFHPLIWLFFVAIIPAAQAQEQGSPIESNATDTIFSPATR